MESVEINNRLHKIPSQRYIQKAITDLRNFTHELYSNYSSDFLNPKFSHKLSNTLANDLHHLDTRALRSIQQSLTSHSSPVKSQNYMPPGKFSTLECEAGLCDLDKFIIRRGGASAHIKYVKERINERLDDLKKKWSNEAEEDYEFAEIADNDLLKNIIQQVVVRGNLIGAIESVLPDEEGNNSLIQQRLEGLLNGSLCLPPAKDQKTDKRSVAVMNYLRAQSPNQCSNLGGMTIKIATPKDGKYWNLSRTLVESYNQGVERLREIVSLLKNLEPLSNEELSTIAVETRQILDDLYIETELYYLLSVLSLLEAK